MPSKMALFLELGLGPIRVRDTKRGRCGLPNRLKSGMRVSRGNYLLVPANTGRFLCAGFLVRLLRLSEDNCFVSFDDLAITLFKLRLNVLKISPSCPSINEYYKTNN